jgi:Ca2+-binding EF-hand superfamily protein
MESINSTQGETHEALIGIFKMFDRDGDGKISAQEFRAVMGSLVEKLTDVDFDRMLREVDLDRDGSISFEEF